MSTPRPIKAELEQEKIKMFHAHAFKRPRMVIRIFLEVF